MSPSQAALLDNLLKILPYAADEEAGNCGISMSEIRERLARLQDPVPQDRQIRRAMENVDSIGFHGATRDRRWYRTIARSQFSIQNMNVNMAMAMCALREVAERYLPAVVLDDLAATFEAASAYLARHRPHVDGGDAANWSRKTLRIDSTHPMVLPRVEPEVYRQVTHALYYGRKLGFRNTPFGEKQPSPRAYEMTPLGMVDRAGVLYMVAWGPRKPGRRFLFRMDRLSEVRLLDEPADLDPDFDLREYAVKEEALNFYPEDEICLVLRAHEPMLADGKPRRHPLREFWLAADQTIEEAENGFVLHARVRPSVMLWQLLHGHASSIEILSPPAARARFAREAQALARAYLPTDA